MALIAVRLVMYADASVAPVAERFVVEAFKIVAVPVAIMLATEKPFAERREVEAFVAVRLVMKPFVKVKPVPEIAVVEAFPSVVCPATPRVPVKYPLVPVKPDAERFVVEAERIVEVEM